MHLSHNQLEGECEECAYGREHGHNRCHLMVDGDGGRCIWGCVAGWFRVATRGGNRTRSGAEISPRTCNLLAWAACVAWCDSCRSTEAHALVPAVSDESRATSWSVSDSRSTQNMRT